MQNDFKSGDFMSDSHKGITKEEKKKKLIEALWRKAVGYSVVESVDELALENGRLVLTKQKINTKEVPPDIAAVKLLMEEAGDELDSMTEEELEREKERLIGLLKVQNDG